MTPATPDKAAPIASLPPLTAVLGVALGALRLALAWGVAQAKGWNARAETVSVGTSAVMGVASVALGALAGLALIWSPTARTARHLGLRVLAAGSTRLMVSLFLGLTLLLVVNPEGYTFFAALTLAAASCMLGEVAWAVSALRRSGGADTITPGAPVR